MNGKDEQTESLTEIGLLQCSPDQVQVRCDEHLDNFQGGLSQLKLIKVEFTSDLYPLDFLHLHQGVYLALDQ